MTGLWRILSAASVAAILLGCGNAPGEEAWGETSQALNACNETVPANRAVDGIPAYAQCDGIEDGAIWSNNGVDTAANSQGTGWVRTQYGGGYQCTEFARRYMLFRWDIDYQHGNAGEWCDGTLPSTLELVTSPTHGDLIVFAPGSCGADSTTGHVAVVDTVDTAGSKVTIVEQNQASRRSTQQSCAKCFLHAVANDGSAGGSGGAGGAASGGAATGGAASGGSTSGGSSSGGAATGGAASGGAAAAGASSGGAAPGGAGAMGTAGSSVSGGSATGGSATGGSATGGSATGGSSASSTSNDDATDASGCSVAAAPRSGGHGAIGLSLALASLLGRFGRRRARARN